MSLIRSLILNTKWIKSLNPSSPSSSLSSSLLTLHRHTFASKSGGKKDDEAAEKDFVSRYERDQLKKRLEKLQKQEDPTNAKAKDNLEKILGKKLRVMRRSRN